MISWLRSGKIWLASTVEATTIVGANMVELQRSSRVEESSQGDCERFVDSVNRSASRHLSLVQLWQCMRDSREEGSSATAEWYHKQKRS